MTSALTSSRLRILVLALVVWAIFVVSWASFYHFTSGGPYSGTTQAILAFALALSWYMVYIAQRFKPTSKKYGILRWTGLFLIFSAAITLLCFGIYHFDTPTGFRSGVTETSLALYLTMLDVLMYIAYKRPTGT